MRKALFTSFAILLLVLPIAACGGSGDDDADSDSPSGASPDAQEEVGLPEVSDCTFAPNTTDSIIAGTATVNGRNTTGTVIGSTSIGFELLDGSGTRIGDEQGTAIILWQPDEEIAFQVGIFSDTPIADATCKITDVSSGQFAEQTAFDHEAATCEIVEPEGQIGLPTAEIDIAGVGDAPSDVELFATGAVYDGGIRLAQINAQFAPGEQQQSAGIAATEGAAQTCKLLELRLP